ncbi:MAG: PASTA domain-containing protein [Angustibacter sp.]
MAGDVPDAVDAIVLHALRKERGARYQTADDFRDDVDAALSGRRISSAALGAVAGAAAAGAATEALGAVPAAAATTTLPPAVPEAAILPGNGGDEFDDKPNRTGLWVLLGLLAAAIIAVAVLVLPGLLGSGGSDTPVVQKVAVPDLSGKTVDEATAALKAKGLTLGEQTTRADDTVPQDQIIDQDPASGSQVDSGTAVTVVVSTGPESVQVPDLVGKTKAQAKAALEQAGLQLGDVTETDTTEQEKGRVVSSNPSSGDQVAKDTKVSIEVASGKVKVPNVIGQPLADATTTLTDAGLKVKAVKYDVSTQPEGTVTAQTHQNDTVDQGTVIELVIAKAAPSTPTETATPSETATPTQTSTPTPTD